MKDNIEQQKRLDGLSEDNIDDSHNMNKAQNIQIYPFIKNKVKNGEKLLDDQPHYLERIS